MQGDDGIKGKAAKVIKHSDVFRHELKYYIDYNQYLNISHRLRQVMQKDPYADENAQYHVRSLYFDDIYDTCLYEKNFGVEHRQKYRIRIYNLSDSVIKLERKTKQGSYVHKESSPLDSEEYTGFINNDMSPYALRSGVVADFYVKRKTGLLRPKVIIDYYREAWNWKGGDVRVTFDKELSAAFNTSDIFDKNVVPIKAIDRSLVIMEVKYLNVFPRFLSDMLGEASHTRSAISKYVIGRTVKGTLY